VTAAELDEIEAAARGGAERAFLGFRERFPVDIGRGERFLVDHIQDNSVEGLRELLGEARKHLDESNRSYHHRTPQALIDHIDVVLALAKDAR
jgi:hypothetical protein